ncbi:hypothetical protein DC498_22885 [Terrimonas sp.]|uniref:nucleotidyltransferase n=1 Tax=Terrimonas sp. TaxID=1914338 RepID=UPI000D50C055|nr:hypothetical protein [Terrimonas sp.]PVD49891.1 hypothetical protein DC498_22885 [Terrimonas sp.]
MNILIEEHQELLLCLAKHRVDFMVVGGYAVIYYGYERITGDLDIWLKSSNANKERLANALIDFGIEKTDIASLHGMDFNNPLSVFCIGEKPRRTDFHTLIDNLKFEEIINYVNYFPLKNKNIPVIHYNHLILSKLTTGRMKDKADIEELERINKYRKKQ